MFKSRRCIFILLCIVMIMGYALPAQAELWGDSYGVGARANGMGGAFTAVADDILAPYYNMAGLGTITDYVVAGEAMYYKPRINVTFLRNGEPLRIYNPDGSVRTDPTQDMAGHNNMFYTPLFCCAMNANKITAPILDPVIDWILPGFSLPNTTFGVIAAITENVTNGLRLQMTAPDEPHFINLGDNANQVLVRVGLGSELITDSLYWGIGVNMMPNVQNTTVYATNYRFQTECQLQGHVQVNLQFSAQFGVLLKLMDHLKLGYAYMGHSEIATGKLRVPASVDVLGGQIFMPISCEIYSAYTPTRNRFGISYTFFDTLLLSCDVVRKSWSKFHYNKVERVLYSEANRVTYGIEGGIPSGPNFDDTTDIHVGAELNIVDILTLRCGVEYMPSPVPDLSNVITNYLAMDTTVFSCGGTIHWKNPDFDLTGALRYYKYDGFTVYKDGQSGITWVPEESYEIEDGGAFSISAGIQWHF